MEQAKRTKFTPEEIFCLKSGYSRIKTVNPDRLADFHALFDSLENEGLAQLANAQIKFVSALAKNEARRRGINI